MTAVDDTPVAPHAFATSGQPLGGLLTSVEVAQMIRVPQATLRYWRHVGIGPRSFKMGPRRVLYRADDVEAWVTAQYADQVLDRTQVQLALRGGVLRDVGQPLLANDPSINQASIPDSKGRAPSAFDPLGMNPP